MIRRRVVVVFRRGIRREVIFIHEKVEAFFVFLIMMRRVIVSSVGILFIRRSRAA